MANLSTLVPAPRILTPSPPNAGDQNNTFIDSSPNSFTITRNGNTTQGTFSPYGDNWSNYFDGTGDDLSLTGQSLAATDWTVECWVYFQSFSNNAPHVWNFGTDINNRYNLWRNSVTGKFSFTRVNGGSYDIQNGTTSPVVGRWYHVAVVRVNSTGVQTLYVDGVAEVTNTGSISAGTTWTLGFVPGGGAADRMLGYISNFRVVTSAVYTANFTPPTAPITAITNTSLLTCSTNRFRDVSSNNRTITRNGDVSVQRFSPFAPVAPYSVSTIGGSGYFDGTGDWLEIASRSGLQPGSNDFCIETWIYPTALPSAGNVARFVSKSAGTYPTGFEYAFYVNDTGVLNFQAYTTGLISMSSAASTIVAGNWYHVVISRSGNNWGLFANGSRVANQTTSGTVQSTSSALAIGRVLETGATQYFTGLISDVRMINGSTAYDPTQTTLTIPTAPLTAITNTSLLLNFTNAGIRDDAMMAAAETVGNAQISTSVKKYGTGSLAFDGTGDYLTLPLSENYRFGTGSFTIEMWLYFNALTTYQCVIDMRNGATAAVGILLYLDGGSSPNVLRLYAAGAQRIASSALSTGQWYHVALSRSGTSTKLFIDGTQQGVTYSTDSNDYIVNSPKISIFSDSVSGYINGYIDDLRITKGVARYTANFTPPQTSLPVDKDTVLLLNGDGTSNSNIQVDTYTTTGTVHTWTKPAGAKAVMINIRGAGGGGGGGQGGAAGTVRIGGGGGGGGARVEQICTADALPNTLYCIVGAGGTGGAAGSSAAGTNGLAGGNSTVAKNNTNPPTTGIIAIAGGGGGGSGGFQASTCGGGGGGGSGGQGVTSVGGGAAGGTPGGSTIYTGNGGGGASGGNQDSGGGYAEWGGGGGGGNRLSGDFGTRSGGGSACGSGGGSGGKCISSGNAVQSSGGFGGSSGSWVDGAATGASGTTGSTGTAGASYLVTGNAGGGGGAGGAGTGGAGGVGGTGGLGGGGGGGGGAGTTDGGAGGPGGNGVIEIITYF